VNLSKLVSTTVKYTALLQKLVQQAEDLAQVVESANFLASSSAAKKPNQSILTKSQTCPTKIWLPVTKGGPG
jgi:hypothetical protein